MTGIWPWAGAIDLITVDGSINLFTAFKKYLYTISMRLSLLITLTLSSLNFSLNGNWIQVGQELVGTASEEYFGEIVKLSSDGLTLMGMSTESNFGGEQTGLVRIYTFNGTNWDIQRNLTGEEYNPITFADLSHSGYLHTYSRYSKQFNTDIGYDGVSNSTYEPFAQNGNGNRFITTDGNSLIVTSRYGGPHGGSSTIWQTINFESETASQFFSGPSITGPGGPGGPGSIDITSELISSNQLIDETITFKSISMTKSGNHFATCVEKTSNFTDYTSIACYATVYHYNGEWIQKGDIIYGNLFSSGNIALNDDGTIIALESTSDNLSDGTIRPTVKVYQYNSSLNNWIQIGQNIFSDYPNSEFAEAIAINEEGTITAIGYKNHDGNGENSGLVRVYQYNGSSWEQLGQDIYGESTNDFFGQSIGMNAEGTRIAVSSQYNDSNGIDAGHIRVFDFIPNQEPVVTPVYELKVFKSTDMNSWDLIETRDVEASEGDLFIKSELSPKASN